MTLPPHWKQVHSGLAVDVLEPTPDMITIEDIAHALALTCRYGGHCPTHFSVAQHCLLVSERAAQIGGGSLELARWGLLHDAAEAYVGDMIRPLKRTPAMSAFRDAEAKVMRTICGKFGLPLEEPAEVRQADAELLATEAAKFFPEERRPGPWSLTGAVLPIIFTPLPWLTAKMRFLWRFAELWPAFEIKRPPSDPLQDFAAAERAG